MYEFVLNERMTVEPQFNATKMDKKALKSTKALAILNTSSGEVVFSITFSK